MGDLGWREHVVCGTLGKAESISPYKQYRYVRVRSHRALVKLDSCARYKYTKNSMKAMRLLASKEVAKNGVGQRLK